MAITQQQIVRDMVQLLKTRGIRLASLGGVGNETGMSSDYYEVYSVAVGAQPAATPSGTLRIVIDFDQAKLDSLGEIASGAEDHIIPKPGRI